MARTIDYPYNNNPDGTIVFPGMTALGDLDYSVPVSALRGIRDDALVWYRAGGFIDLTASTWTTVTWDNKEAAQTRGAYSATAPGAVLTIAEDGVYILSSVLDVVASSGSRELYARHTVNNAEARAYGYDMVTTERALLKPISSALQLTAGDQIRVQVFCNQVAGVFGFTTAYSRFALYRVK